MIYFYSDPHFGHENIISYCKRPFRNSHLMDKYLIGAYNAKVEPEDTVYFLGDLMMGGPDKKEWLERIVSKLHGHKHLIMGNHDRLKPFDYEEIGFESVHTRYAIYDGMIIKLMHDPAPICGQEEMVIYVYGHLHNNKVDYKNAVSACVELNNYAPISLDDVYKKVQG